MLAGAEMIAVLAVIILVVSSRSNSTSVTQTPEIIPSQAAVVVDVPTQTDTAVPATATSPATVDSAPATVSPQTQPSNPHSPLAMVGDRVKSPLSLTGR
ncbi:MAG: hypothetical protein QM771_07210 [Nitrospira sp.]